MRTKSFAERIIDSMVDENGHCGERGLSPKQFAILSEHLEEGETENRGGAYNRTFTSTDFTGVIGRLALLRVAIRKHPKKRGRAERHGPLLLAKTGGAACRRYIGNSFLCFKYDSLLYLWHHHSGHRAHD